MVLNGGSGGEAPGFNRGVPWTGLEETTKRGHFFTTIHVIHTLLVENVNPAAGHDRVSERQVYESSIVAAGLHPRSQLFTIVAGAPRREERRKSRFLSSDRLLIAACNVAESIASQEYLREEQKEEKSKRFEGETSAPTVGRGPILGPLLKANPSVW